MTAVLTNPKPVIVGEALPPYLDVDRPLHSDTVSGRRLAWLLGDDFQDRFRCVNLLPMRVEGKWRTWHRHRAEAAARRLVDEYRAMGFCRTPPFILLGREVALEAGPEVPRRAPGGTVIHHDVETFQGFIEWLREVQERNGGVIRVEMNPVNKHSEEALYDEADLPRFPLECLLPEAEEALEALVALKVVDRYLVIPAVELAVGLPRRSSWFRRRVDWLRDMLRISRG